MDDDELTHFLRTCGACGNQWAGLHCPHDGVQNPCPACGVRPVVEAEPASGCECEFDA